jgi:hypothetical protein
MRHVQEEIFQIRRNGVVIASTDPTFDFGRNSLGICNGLTHLNFLVATRHLNGQRLLFLKIRTNPSCQFWLCPVSNIALSNYCAITHHGQAGLSSSGLPQVSAIQSRIHFQLALGRVLYPIGRSFWDEIGPLLNCAARVADRTRHRRSVIAVIRQNISLSHSPEGTAC